MNESKNITPSIKRVISVDFMGASNKINRNEDLRKKNVADLNNLNTLRNYSVIDTMKKSDIRESLFKDLLTQSSEMNSLKEKDFEAYKINPLFNRESNEDLTKSQAEAPVQNVAKIEVSNNIGPSNLPTEITDNKLTNLFEKNKTNAKEKKVISQNEAPKIIVKSKYEDNFNFETLSIATSNDEPIYMDPSDLVVPNNVPFDQKSQFRDSFSQKSTQMDSISQKFYSSVSSDESSIVDNSPTMLSFKTSSTVFQLKIRKRSVILKEAKLLRNEINQMNIVLDIKPTDILYNIVLVDLYQKIWIGNLSSPTIGNYLHYGDQVLSINGETPNDVESLIQIVKKSKESLISLKLRRVPYARIITICDIHTEFRGDQLQMNLENDVSIELLREKFGIKLKQNTAKIEKIYENGFLYKNGLKYDPNKVSYELDNANKLFTPKRNDQKERLSKWVITEINGDLINYRTYADEILARLKLNDTASIIVQPYDLVKALFNQKKA